MERSELLIPVFDLGYVCDTFLIVSSTLIASVGQENVISGVFEIRNEMH